LFLSIITGFIILIAATILKTGKGVAGAGMYELAHQYYQLTKGGMEKATAGA
jgi:hypothetical protein